MKISSLNSIYFKKKRFKTYVLNLLKPKMAQAFFHNLQVTYNLPLLPVHGQEP